MESPALNGLFKIISTESSIGTLPCKSSLLAETDTSTLHMVLQIILSAHYRWFAESLDYGIQSRQASWGTTSHISVLLLVGLAMTPTIRRPCAPQAQHR